MSLLLAFEASARLMSFTQAGRELSLSQSAISKQVQALEALLGVALFRREGRRLLLTAAGEVYQRELAQGLQRIRSASLQAIAHGTGAGALHLAALPTFTAKWLLPKLSDFYKEHPGVLVHIHSRIGRFDPDPAGVDAVIGVGDGDWPGLQAHHLLDEYVVPVMSPQVAREFPVKRPADLAGHLLLQLASRSDVWQRWFQAHGLDEAAMRPGPRFELTSHLIQAAASGIGVGLLPQFLVRDELASGVLVQPTAEPFATGAAYYLFIPKAKADLPPVAAFRNWLLDQAMQ